MSNKRITDLTELTNPTSDDVFPVVDIATNTTTKVQLGNLPVPTSVTSALATKENTITPGTTAQYFRGDKSFQTLDKTAVGLANVDNTSDANKPVSTAQQTALNAKQDTLVSGTNIKTLNSTSLLGSGNIVLTANPSGVSGAIQFSNGSAFASDAANLFWDDTNNRLGVGTNVPNASGHFRGAGITSATSSLIAQNSAGTTFFQVQDDSAIRVQDGGLMKNFSATGTYNLDFGRLFIRGGDSSSNGALSIGTTSTAARVVFQGSGSTSATTSLLVQNSAGTAALQVRDDTSVVVGTSLTVGGSINADRAISQAGNSGLTLNTSFNSQQAYPRFGLTTDVSVFYYQGNYNPTSGSGAFAVFNATPTINQTGGANGITRGLYINPTLTAAADFRAIEVSNGGAYINTTSVQASAILQADSTTKGFLPPRMTTTQKNAIASPAAGLIVYDSTLGKLCVRTASAWETITSV